jgi:hypothetical protein
MAKRKKDDLQNITHETKDRVTRTPLNTWGKLMCALWYLRTLLIINIVNDAASIIVYQVLYLTKCSTSAEHWVTWSPFSLKTDISNLMCTTSVCSGITFIRYAKNDYKKVLKWDSQSPECFKCIYMKNIWFSFFPNVILCWKNTGHQFHQYQQMEQPLFALNN